MSEDEATRLEKAVIAFVLATTFACYNRFL